MLVTGPLPDTTATGSVLRNRHVRRGSKDSSSRKGSPSMGFLKTSHHQKMPSPLTESFTERFSNILDNCQKKIRLLHGPSSLFTTLVTKARRKDRECASSQDQEQKLYLEEAVLERKIPETDLRQLVELPPGLGYEEWLASHTIDFFTHINLVYGTICEFCTLSGCPDMTGPSTRQYLWFDEKGKKTRVTAPQYVDYVMTFTQKTINDDTIFPTKFDSAFPVSFESIVKKIHRLLFHVVAHLYHCHFREVVLLNLHAHLNCLFAHFILFNERFHLIDEKETEILDDLVVALKLHTKECNDGPAPLPSSPPQEGTSVEDGGVVSTSLSDNNCNPVLSSSLCLSEGKDGLIEGAVPPLIPSGEEREHRP